MDTMPTQQTVGGKGGSSLAIIIIILIVALGGAYFWYSRTAKVPVTNNNTKAQPSVSIPVASLEKDLNAAGSVDIGADMNGFDQVYK